ncbi:MAG TPA: AAA family ATPase [Steroidobacteraceae bacterium]|jgi:RecA-family ATPase|nr:AAA family ATPase [Steroidobacteraceae bacterium]
MTVTRRDHYGVLLSYAAGDAPLKPMTDLDRGLAEQDPDFDSMIIEKAREIEARRNGGDPHADMRSAISKDLAAGADAIDDARAPDMVVHARVPRAGGNLAGAGNVGKTTLVLNEYVHITGGGKLYGDDVIQKGVCILVTAEDGAAYPRYLLKRVLEDGVRCGRLPETVAQNAKTAVKIVSWSRSKYGPIAIADRDGNVFRAPGFDVMIELFGPLQPSAVTLDPLVLFSPGERFGNDSDAFVASMLHEAALELGCFFQVLDHVSQSVARTGIVDQHAARGGTAKTDNARLARQLVRFKPDSELSGGRPLNISDEEIASGRILQLHWTKFNYAPLPPFAWLRRTGYWIEHLKSASIEQQEETARRENELRDAEDESAVIEKLQKLNGARLSKKALEDSGVIRPDGVRLARGRLRGALERLISANKITLAQRPKDEIRGADKHYLQVHAPL